MHEEIKDRLRSGEPWSARFVGGELLVLCSLPEGFLVAVEAQGCVVMTSQEVPTIWDLVGGGIDIRLAEQVYEFLGELFRRPRRRYQRLQGRWVERPEQPGHSALNQQTIIHHGTEKDDDGPTLS